MLTRSPARLPARLPARVAARLAAAFAAGVLLTACTGDGEGSGSGPGDAASEEGAPEEGASEEGASEEGTSGDGTASRGTASGGTASGGATSGGSPAPYLPVPDGVVLTDPGSELGLGEQATVAWRPRQGQIGVLNVKVRKLVRADIKALEDWQLDAAERTSALYYVTVTVANVGDQDLSERRIPLYVLDGANALVESSAFKTDFEPCPSPALPDGFVTGEKTTVCQAYLVPKPGELRAVSFRPTPGFNPITWVGKVKETKPARRSSPASP